MGHAATLSYFEVTLRLLLAMFLGSAIGLERERLDRAAGLRTHTVVSVGSALFMIVSAFGFYDIASSTQVISLDPSRIAAQVVSGIGFLGAGVIIFRKGTIRGLTTAASVWSMAGVGLACGGGLYFVAIVATLVLLLVQAGLRPIERRLFARNRDHRLVLRAGREVGALAAVENVFDSFGAELRGLTMRQTRGGLEDRFDIVFGVSARASFATILDRLGAIPGVRVVTYAVGVDALASTRSASSLTDERQEEASVDDFDESEENDEKRSP